MRKYIKKIQSKSEDVRKQILVTSLVACMSLVLFIWVGTIGHKFNNKTSVAKTENEIKPFSLFSKTVSDTYKNVSASAGNIKSKIEESKEEGKVIELIPVEYTN